MTMQNVRKAREMTQVRMAEILGKSQVTIAQIEKRTDMLLSTLRSYIEAMGGQLDLVVRFPDRDPIILQALCEEKEPVTPRSRPRSEGAAAHS
jgi:DNA-binding XRE family transcriptional regulator